MNIPGSGNYLEDMEDQRQQEEGKSMERTLFVGDIVITTVKDLLGNKGGTKGVVYEEYYIGGVPGVSIIFENGEYDGFNHEEQESMILKVGHDNWSSNYKFKNVQEVSDDFRAGYWESVFNE